MSPFASAAAWIEGLVLGQAATLLAVIAVAMLGMAMLAGRLDWRHGMRVVIGCFVLFAAPTIAHGLLDLARGSGEAAMATPVDSSAGFTPPPPPARETDPYAGAHVPQW